MAHPSSDPADDFIIQIKKNLLPHILAEVDTRLIDLQSGNEEDLKKRLEEVFEEKLQSANIPLGRKIRERALEMIISEVIG
jgi:hypothetical protein